VSGKTMFIMGKVKSSGRMAQVMLVLSLQVKRTDTEFTNGLTKHLMKVVGLIIK